MGVTNQATRRIEDRAEPRDEVLHRSRMTLADRRAIAVTVVNLSPNGMMMRADVEVATGERIEVALPVVGTVAATVRWSLGGRLGCELFHPVDARRYHALLHAIA
jgi:hypothetical protein